MFLRHFVRSASTVSSTLRPRVQLPQLTRRIWPIRQYNGRSQYQRFGGGYSSGNFFQRWASRPTFYYEVGGLSGAGGLFYIYNLEEVPVSGRRRFRVVSAETEEAMGQQMYGQVMQQYGNQILPERDPRTQAVKKVLERLIPHSGITDANWEVHVIDSPETNAFVIPGGKVFVFTGILPICRTIDGIATVLGHEIAHNVAHHSAERMSQAFIIYAAFFLITATLGAPDFATQWLLDLGFSRPGSRRQESEADYIGLMMMAESCYNPEEAVGVWQRMQQAEQHAPPQFLSTHPSSHNRMEKMQEWMQKAYDARNASDCGVTAGFVDQFRDRQRF